MKEKSKRVKSLYTEIYKESYLIDEGIELLKKIGNAKFNESVEAHINLNVDPKHINQQIRTTLVLPHGTGKDIKIAVFTEDNIEEIKNMGAYIVGSQILLDDISSGKINFDILLTTANLMPKLTKFGKILGPKGLMPSPKSGTIVTNFKDAIYDFKKGKIECRTDKNGIIHIQFGKIDFSSEKLKENLLKIYQSIEKNKPVSVKSRYFDSFYICTTMSPSLKIELGSLKKISSNS